MSETKTVLVHFLEHARPVNFSRGREELESRIRETYKDVLQERQQLFLKVGRQYPILKICIETQARSTLDSDHG